MSADEVDTYLVAVAQPKHETLETLRRTILEIVPDAQQAVSHRTPAFRIRGRSWRDLPRSTAQSSIGSTVSSLVSHTDQQLLHFPVDQALPKKLVEGLIAARVDESDHHSR
jgi:uncharacterized protein YdhG (YjbR/CyaY superfamily)